MAHLIVTTRNCYGNELIDPVNEAAQAIARIGGTKTLKFDHLCLAVRALGCTLEWQGSVITGVLAMQVRLLAGSK